MHLRPVVTAQWYMEKWAFALMAILGGAYCAMISSLLRDWTIQAQQLWHTGAMISLYVVSGAYLLRRWLVSIMPNPRPTAKA